MPRRFLDPLYSPGMDWISFTVTATAALIAAERRGEPVAPLIERHNADFTRSYRRWFEAIYQDKYEYLGEFDLMRLAFRMDLGLYYLGIVSQPFKFGAEALRIPPFRADRFDARFITSSAPTIAASPRSLASAGAGAHSARRTRHGTYLFPSFSLSPPMEDSSSGPRCGGWASS